MLKDFYLNIAKEMLDLADERIAEAKAFQKKAEELVALSSSPEEDYKEVLKTIKKEHKLTGERIAKKMGVSGSAFTQSFRRGNKVSFSTVMRWIKAMELDLCIVEPGGIFHRLSTIDYYKDKGKGFTPYRQRSTAELADSPEVFFK